jgi:hypothetical protein
MITLLKQKFTLNEDEEHKLGSSHLSGTRIRCTVITGKGSLTVREYGAGLEGHIDGPFDLPLENVPETLEGEIIVKGKDEKVIELDLDKVHETPEWEVSVKGMAAGANEFMLELLGSTMQEKLNLEKNQEYKLGSSHLSGTHVRCAVEKGKGSITVREYGTGIKDSNKEHIDGPFDLSSEIGERYSIELDLDKVEKTPEWEVIVRGMGEGENELTLELFDRSSVKS